MIRIKPSSCPTCDKLLNAATAVEGEAEPAPGDVTVCIECASFLTFKEDLALRLLTPDEIAELDDDIRMTLIRVREDIGKIKTR